MERDNKTVNINIRVDADTKAALDKLAEKDRRSLSDYLRLQFEKIIEAAKK